MQQTQLSFGFPNDGLPDLDYYDLANLNPPCNVIKAFYLKEKVYFIAEELHPVYEKGDRKSRKQVGIEPTGCYFMASPIKSYNENGEYQILTRFTP